MKLTILTACLLALLAACHNKAKSSLDVLKDSLSHYLDSPHKMQNSLRKDFGQQINDDTQITNNWVSVDSVSFAIVGSGGGSLTPIDTAQNVTKNPMIADGHLCEVVIIQQGGRVAYSGVEKITTCERFRQFRKDYPEFYIPAPVLATFRKCQWH